MRPSTRRLLLLSLGLSLWATSSRAGEIEMRQQRWDDLAIALGVKSFYVEIRSPQTAHQAQMEVEVYKEGRLLQTISSTGIIGMANEPPKPLNVNCAIHFVPKDDMYAGKIVFQWEKNFGIADFSVKKDDIRFEKGGLGSSAFTNPVAQAGRTPIFQIICGASSLSPQNTPSETLKANPHACILIGYLVKK